MWQRACTALENANRQNMTFPHPIKPEGVSGFAIWLSMCPTFVKFTLFPSVFHFPFFLSFAATTTSPFILPHFGTEIFILARDAFLPSAYACPQMLITAPS